MRRPSPTSAKRWTIKLALVGVCLLAGAVVTWGVAWGLALFGPGRELRQAEMTAFSDGFFQIPSTWAHHEAGDYVILKQAEYRSPGYRLAQADRRLLRPGQKFLIHIARWRIATGLPMKALDLAGTLDADGTIKSSGKDVPAPVARHLNISALKLPTRVLPLGFALNTLFYAAVLLGVVEGVAFARRRARRGKGRCPACGYHPAGLAEGAACPECGS